MENKVLVQFIMPEIDAHYDAFVPVNELIWKIKKMALKSISDLSNIPIDLDKEYVLLNKDNCKIYSNNDIVINTDIKNGSELILLSKD